MISGEVRNREAIIQLEVAGFGQLSRRLTTIIDTGFDGHLTLPTSSIEALRLPFAGYRRGTLADGTTTRLGVYMGRVVWHGQHLEVLALQAEGEPLVGMSLLEGSQLTIEVGDGGAVIIEELS